MENKFLAGFARVDITPTESVPLRGYGNTSQRMSRGVHTRLYLSCLAFTDEEGTTALLLPTDLCTSDEKVCGAARKAISELAGVDVDSIIFTSTHTHAAPDPMNLKEPSILRYNAAFVEKAVEVAGAAMADRKAVTGMYISDIATERMNFVRRYVLEDGTYAGDNYGHPSKSPIVAHESEVDNQLQLVKFTREGGKDLLIANFQGHPHSNRDEMRYLVNSGIQGPFRENVEALLDCCASYITGGSGNVNSTSRMAWENTRQNTPEEHGKLMGEYAAEAAKRFRPVALGPIRVRHRHLDMPANHTEDHLEPIAAQVRQLWQETNDGKACRQLGRPYGIHSPFHANAIGRKVTLGPTLGIDLWTFAIGDVGFVAAPYEMFDSSGVEIKNASPYAMTVICTCANEAKGYMPSRLGWDHGGYSVDTCNFCPGCAEVFVENFLEMLREQKAED